jgi:hypothetical protein
MTSPRKDRMNEYSADKSRERIEQLDLQKGFKG